MSIKGDVSDGGNEYIFGCWVGFFPIRRVTHKGSGKGGTVHTCDIFGKKVYEMLAYDSGRFCIKGLLVELLQISRNCVTECTLQPKFLLKVI